MTEPVALAEVKAHLRLEADATDEDAYLESLIVAARRVAELRTRRTIAGDVPTLTGGDLALANQAMLLIIEDWHANREGSGEIGRWPAHLLGLVTKWADE